MKFLFPLCAALVCLSGCADRSTHSLGTVSAPGPVTAVSDLKPLAVPTTVRGVMIEKCPISGCWFKLRDRSGVVKVDTKAAGFVVADVPLSTVVTVSGKFQTQPERQFEASGLQY